MSSLQDCKTQREQLQEEMRSVAASVMVGVTVLVIVTLSTLLNASESLMEFLRRHVETPYGFGAALASFIVIDLVVTAIVVRVRRRFRHQKTMKSSIF